jgi:PEP-CTERM motif-containing protein
MPWPTPVFVSPWLLSSFVDMARRMLCHARQAVAVSALAVGAAKGIRPKFSPGASMKHLKEILREVRRGIVIAAGMAAVGVSGTSAADPITFLPSASDLEIVFVDREIVITGAGQMLFGIFNITAITNLTGTQTYWAGNGLSDGTQLVGFFTGLISEADQTGGTGLSFTGGTFTIYDVPNGQYQPGAAPNTQDFAALLCGGACPATWLSGIFVPGVNDSIGGDATLQAAIASTNVAAGDGFLSVTGGANLAFFDTNGFTFANFGPADLSLRSNFSLAGGGLCSVEQSSGWFVCSNDPITARTVPEPATLLLLGGGLIGLALSRRRSH